MLTFGSLSSELPFLAEHEIPSHLREEEVMPQEGQPGPRGNPASSGGAQQQGVTGQTTNPGQLACTPTEMGGSNRLLKSRLPTINDGANLKTGDAGGVRATFDSPTDQSAASAAGGGSRAPSWAAAGWGDAFSSTCTDVWLRCVEGQQGLVAGRATAVLTQDSFGYWSCLAAMLLSGPYSACHLPSVSLPET